MPSLVPSVVVALCSFAPQEGRPATAPEIQVRRAQEAAPFPQNGAAARVEIYDVRDLALPAALWRFVPEAEPSVAREQPALSGEAALRAWLVRRETADRHAPVDGVQSDLAAWRVLETLVRCLATKIDPTMSCTAQPSGALVVRATPAAHEQVDGILKHLRHGEPETVSIEVLVVELDESARELVATLSTQETAKGESAPATISTLSKDGVAKLVAHAGCKTIDHPNLVALQLDPFSVHMGSEVSYVAGIEQVAIEGVGHIADPVVKTVKEGTLIEGRALVANAVDRSDVPPLFAARIEVQYVLLKRPIATMKTALGSIQLPEVKSATIATTLAATCGAPVLVGGIPVPVFDAADEGKQIYLLVTVDLQKRAGKQGPDVQSR